MAFDQLIKEIDDLIGQDLRVSLSALVDTVPKSEESQMYPMLEGVGRLDSREEIKPGMHALSMTGSLSFRLFLYRAWVRQIEHVKFSDTDEQSYLIRSDLLFLTIKCQQPHVPEDARLEE